MAPDPIKLLKGRLGNRGYEAVTVALAITEEELRAWITEEGLDKVTLECWRMIAANEALNNFKFATSDGEEVDKTKITEHALKMLEKWEKNVATSTPVKPTTFKINYGTLRSY